MDLNNMLFKKRKPNHLVIYIDYHNTDSDRWILKTFSKLTYNVGPVKTLDEAIEGTEKFFQKYPNKVKSITINTYGVGKNLVNCEEVRDDKSKLKKLDELLDLVADNIVSGGNMQFATCYAGIPHRKLVEMSERYNGIRVMGLIQDFRAYPENVTCECKKKGYSKKIINSLPKSRYGFEHDEQLLLDLHTRGYNEKVNWKSGGMAYEYNRIVLEDGVCIRNRKPFHWTDCFANYLFNTDKWKIKK